MKLVRCKSNRTTWGFSGIESGCIADDRHLRGVEASHGSQLSRNQARGVVTIVFWGCRALRFDFHRLHLVLRWLPRESAIY
jgi:hypothetical protein